MRIIGGKPTGKRVMAVPGARHGRCRTGVIVAHPDDEILWAGGTILMDPDVQYSIFSLCRGSDPDRAPRFARALKCLHATGCMADLDDGPDQHPLPEMLLEQTILSLVGDHDWDLLISHSPHGEYTRHLRHEETGRMVESLWRRGTLRAGELWQFAYRDDGAGTIPFAIPEASLVIEVPDAIWKRKRAVVRRIYGFGADSWEARTAPRVEAFWTLQGPGIGDQGSGTSQSQSYLRFLQIRRRQL